ncbi:YesL family protein [Pontibacillus litoralis]|uniref:DUF624 domain-containing protein n=1 Tax=Pontibacillus litoralis JSM 072002 TaxID=1385512 RepID=A0A0A5G3T2_9BACI|nr:DUF624 domain-containing protein [Pontibacillus litoralis]KGX87781.1 hypothetical protein N784_14335 [Pontibacillus litoralis JSM 072002]
MKNEVGFMGGIYAVCEWFMQFSLVNIQWFLFNIPIALLLINVIYIQSVEQFVYVMMPVALLVPVLFFPASVAVMCKAREWVRKEEMEDRTRTFIHYYKENYKHSMLGGTIFTVLWGILVLDIIYFTGRNVMLMNIFLAFSILLFVFTVNFFIVSAHFDMKLGIKLKQSLLLTLGSPKLFITIAVSLGIILYISLYIFPLLIPFFTCSMMAFLAFAAFYRLQKEVVGE